MTSTATSPAAGDCDDAVAVLAALRQRKRAEDDAARDVFQAAAAWAAMHSTGSLIAPLEAWHETAVPIGGEGCPEVAEFAVTELAASLGRSRESGRRYLACAVEARYRLPRSWDRLVAGDLQAWRLAAIAEQTMALPPAAAAFVDAHVAGVAHKVGPAQLDRLVAEARARFDPDGVEAERLAAAERRRFDIHLSQTDVSGTVVVEGELDLADALDLEAAIAASAEELRALGSTEPLDVRRSQAAGALARAEQALDLVGPQSPVPPPRRRRRQVVLHVHLSQTAITGPALTGRALTGRATSCPGELARLDETPGPVTVEQVRTWCGSPETTVTLRPVLDLAGHVHVDSYEAPDRLRTQVELRDGGCVFPYCTRPARRCDLDHRVPHADGGPTCTTNLAPLCRSHHRAKTNGGWTYTAHGPTGYRWRSPYGFTYLRDHTGTLEVTPDPDRRRPAHTFLPHATKSEPEP